MNGTFDCINGNSPLIYPFCQRHSFGRENTKYVTLQLAPPQYESKNPHYFPIKLFSKEMELYICASFPN